MISSFLPRSRALRAALVGAAVCVFLGWSKRSSAQSSSLEPGLFTLNPLNARARDQVEPEHSRESEKSRQDHFQLGALVSASFPRPLSVEGLAKFEKLVALGLEYSTLPSITVNDVHVDCWAVTGSVRVFPLRGPFFVGLRAGRQHLNADATLSAYGYSTPVGLGVDTTFLNPQVGFLWTWDPGFSLGIDAGLQIPLSSSSSSNLQTSTMPAVAQQAVAPVQQTLEDVAKTVGQTTLPTVDLIRIGVLF